MAEALMIGDGESQNSPKVDGHERQEKGRKRKRGAGMLSEKLGNEERESQIDVRRREIVGLFGYYKEVMGQKVVMDGVECNSSNAVVSVLLEESNLPLSKLVFEIYEKMQKKTGVESGGETMTLASVKAAVLLVGQRVMYGVPNADADVLEDDSESCLWCWETRDVKLMPKSIRGTLNIRRTCRRKIHERITAVSAMVKSLQTLEYDQNYNQDFRKASERLSKVFDEAKIRSFVDGLSRKNNAEIADKETKREEKLLAKQLERNMREAEREKKRMDRELEKQKARTEKELKEAEKEERRRDREEIENRKQRKKQQEEAEKEMRRREKEANELKKELSIQKQASIMDHFLKRAKPSPVCYNDQSSAEGTASVSSNNKSENINEAVTQLMDNALQSNDLINAEDILKAHLSSWHGLGHAIRSNKKQHWGLRQKPKTELLRDLKLSTCRGLAHDDEVGIEKLVDVWAEQIPDDRKGHNYTEASLSAINKNRWKQLLQFDKSHRPAFYGIWPKKSNVVRPRNPLRKDPVLEYDVDSDEEWREEDPGESLSDCDNDEEDILEGCSKSDDDNESEDSFMVPDGYLSENEGVQVDRMASDDEMQEVRSSPICENAVATWEFRTLLREQKYLSNLTEFALRKNQPLIILNIFHEKDSLLMAEDLSGTARLEQTCLQALSICVIPGESPIEISLDTMQGEDQEAHIVCVSGSTSSTISAIPEPDLPTVVSTILSCSQGINKVVESLQLKFPTASKSYLRNKVREVSYFADNHWQVKKEILDRVGLSISPEKGGRRMKSIATFFSKRCLPPTGKTINPCETSHQSSLKSGSSVNEGQGCINHQ